MQSLIFFLLQADERQKVENTIKRFHTSLQPIGLNSYRILQRDQKLVYFTTKVINLFPFAAIFGISIWCGYCKHKASKVVLYPCSGLCMIHLTLHHRTMEKEFASTVNHVAEEPVVFHDTINSMIFHTFTCYVCILMVRRISVFWGKVVRSCRKSPIPCVRQLLKFYQVFQLTPPCTI